MEAYCIFRQNAEIVLDDDDDDFVGNRDNDDLNI